MEDVAAKRREARRRRILENSESRLQKITGRPVEKDDDLHGKFNENILEGGFGSTGSKTKSSFEREVEEIIRQNQKDYLNGVPSSSFDEKTSSVNDDSSHTDNSTTNNDQQSKPKTNKLNDNYLSTKVNSGSEEVERSWLWTLLSSRVIYLLLALVVNMNFLISGTMFYTGILLPFISVSVPQYIVGLTPPTSPQQNMLMSALILCSIRPDVIYRLRRIMLIFNNVLKDFAIYIVSLVLIQWVISFYVGETSEGIQFH